MMDTQTQKQIVVIGAGYAGLMATQRLARKLRRAGVTITLINSTEHFVNRLWLRS